MACYLPIGRSDVNKCEKETLPLSSKIKSLTCVYSRYNRIILLIWRIRKMYLYMGGMLCESWNGVKGSETYDPSAHFSSDITIATGTGPAKPDGFTLLGSYIITSEGVNYYATLSWKDVASGLRALNVIMAWPLQEPTITDFDNTNKLFNLTTYTTN